MNNSVRNQQPPQDGMVLPSAPPLPDLDDYANHEQTFHAEHSMWANDQNHSKVTPPPDAIDEDGDPSAPPLEFMDKFQGYESVSFEAAEIPPPLLPSSQKTEEEPQRCPLPCIPQLTEKEAREALSQEVASHCCYGNGTVRDMAVTEMKHHIAFHYTLETFTEKRTTCWAVEPYLSGSIDKHDSSLAPLPWDVPVTPSSNFQSNSTQVEVPHTASIKTCHVCGGVGRKRCTTCSGNGWEYCFSCHGDGHKASALESENGRCLQCHGTGRRRCWKCNGDGMASCKGCSGTGQIKCYIRLNVIWTNHVDDHVVEKVSALNADRIRSVSGELVCQEEGEILWPLTHFPDTTVSMASAQLIQDHATSFSTEKLIKQRHRVCVVPIAAVSYKWKNHEGVYHVYGYERKVYAPNYPQTCCCCCCRIV